jgi:hypothetical protein
MKNLGYLLIGLGCLAGALVAVQTSENTVAANFFLPAFAVAVVGVVLARVGARQESHEEGALQSNFEIVGKSIDLVVGHFPKLNVHVEAGDPYAMSETIDRHFREDLTAFADARQSIGILFSLTDYAAVMNDFAAGERYLNRVWSCSIDGYIDEASEYVGRAEEQFVAARDKLAALKQKKDSQA